MKKIMFNDKYDLTQAVLDGRKTQTRRLVSDRLHEVVEWDSMDNGKAPIFGTSYWGDVRDYGRYKIGEVVAIAQRYEVVWKARYSNESAFYKEIFNSMRANKGWKNKMFVKAAHMMHHIRINNVRVERLQDISDADCMAEGLVETTFERQNGEVIPAWTTLKVASGGEGPQWCGVSPRAAFSELICKTCGKKTWERNPWVFIYDFVLID